MDVHVGNYFTCLIIDFPMSTLPLKGVQILFPTVSSTYYTAGFQKMQLDVEESTPACDFTQELQLAIAIMLLLATM